jgi:hypothetical protein
MEVVAIQNLKEIVLAGLKSYQALAEAKKNDGKIDLKDLALILPVVPHYIDAIQGAGEVGAELKDLSTEEAAELVSLISQEIGVAVSPELHVKIEKILLAVKANYEAVRAFV